MPGEEEPIVVLAPVEVNLRLFRPVSGIGGGQCLHRRDRRTVQTEISRDIRIIGADTATQWTIADGLREAFAATRQQEVSKGGCTASELTDEVAATVWSGGES